MEMTFELAMKLIKDFELLALHANNRFPQTQEEIEDIERYIRHCFRLVTECWETENRKWTILPPDFDDFLEDEKLLGQEYTSPRCAIFASKVWEREKEDGKTAKEQMTECAKKLQSILK